MEATQAAVSLIRGPSQLLDDLALIVGVFLSDLLRLVGAPRLFFKARLLVGQSFWNVWDRNMRAPVGSETHYFMSGGRHSVPY
jgi:hypothetical protein